MQSVIRSRVFVSLLIWTLLLPVLPVTAADRDRLYGFVNGADGITPLPGVTVRVVDVQTGGVVAEMPAKADGSYEIPNLEVGKDYRLSASIGTDRVEKVVTLNKGQNQVDLEFKRITGFWTWSNKWVFVVIGAGALAVGGVAAVAAAEGKKARRVVSPAE